MSSRKKNLPPGVLAGVVAAIIALSIYTAGDMKPIFFIMVAVMLFGLVWFAIWHLPIYEKARYLKAIFLIIGTVLVASFLWYSAMYRLAGGAQFGNLLAYFLCPPTTDVCTWGNGPHEMREDTFHGEHPHVRDFGDGPRINNNNQYGDPPPTPNSH